MPYRLSLRPSAVVLAIVLTCQLMIVLDASIVMTALPEIHTDLGFSATSLSWVQNAYALAFGGLLLLGARAGDLLGRRRVFIAGLALFTGASLIGGLAQSEGWLLAARAAQGVGAAIAAPATLALLLTTFAEGPPRVNAIALYSSASAAGASIGVLLGGVLTDLLSWRWGMFINVPIGAVMVLAARGCLCDRAARSGDLRLPGRRHASVGHDGGRLRLRPRRRERLGRPYHPGRVRRRAALLAAFVRDPSGVPSSPSRRCACSPAAPARPRSSRGGWPWRACSRCSSS